MKKHGGSRRGAGRKPSLAPHKVPLTIRIDPELHRYLQSAANKTETIESALRKSRDFRTWIAGQH